MKRPATAMMPRPKSLGTGTARTRKEAAIQLVRLEFDISRLERAIALANQRVHTQSAELALHAAEREKLMLVLRS